MVTVQVKNIEGKTVLPVAGSSRSAGYDLIAIDEPTVIGVVGMEQEIDGNKILLYQSIDYLEYHTALYISPQWPSPTAHDPGFYHTELYPRSSVRKYNLVLANSIGLVDNDYRGEIIICFKYLWQPEDFVLTSENRLLAGLNWTKVYRKGDKIGQLVASKTNPIQFVLVSELDATERGTGGFGSTDTITITREKLHTLPTTPETTEKDVQRLDQEHKTAFSPIVERYQKAGGVPVKRRYSDEIKERDGE